jgi:short-subunit dehydrogenase
MHFAGKPRKSWNIRLGWWLVLGSVPVWCLVFVAPFMPFSVGVRAALGAGAIVAGEAMFWLGLVVLGPTVAAQLRAPDVRTGKSYAGRRVAVVGATGGLGSSIVQALLREGAEVVAMGRSMSRLQALGGHERLHLAEIDLGDLSSIDSAGAAVDGVDAVIVATGIDVRKPLLQHTDADVSHQLNVNLLGPIRLTRAFAPRIRRGGVIAHLGGFGDGRLALPYYSVDVASRAGLAAFCESINREFELEGMAVTAAYLCPEPADTEAERPYAALWTRMGTPPVEPAKVADFVLRSVLGRKRSAVMGCRSWMASKVNALWSAAADLAGIRRAGTLLRVAFGTRAAS